MTDHHRCFLRCKINWIINWRLYLWNRSLMIMMLSKSIMITLGYRSCQMSDRLIVYKVFLRCGRNNSGKRTFLNMLRMTYWLLKLFWVHRSSHWKAWVEVTFFSLWSIQKWVCFWNIKRLWYWLRLRRLILIRLIRTNFLSLLLIDDFHSASPPFFIVFVDTIKF